MGRKYCGKRFGPGKYLTGFLLGSVPGFLAAFVIYGNPVLEVAAAVAAGVFASKAYVGYLINRRKKEFTLEFCDYLDAVGSSLSCGKNSYEAFLLADEDMHGLYPSSAPVCFESRRVAEGLKSGRGIDELLRDMAVRTGSEDVEIFSDVYSVCNTAGGNLRMTVSDTKAAIAEKISIENEINTSLAAPKNELNIMAVMPVAITAALKILSVGKGGETSFVMNTVAVVIFIFAYALGMKIVKIEV